MHVARHKHEWRIALRKAKLRSWAAYIVGLYMIDECLNSRTGALHPKVETIARECGLPEDTVRSALKVLKKAGLMVSKKRRFNGPPDYFMRLPDVARTGLTSPVRDDDEQVIGHPSNGSHVTRRTGHTSPDSTLEENHGRAIMEESRRRGEAAGIRFADPSGVRSLSRSHPASGSSEPANLDDDLLEEGRMRL